MLASGGTQQEAADAAGVHRVTVNHWMQDPTFAAAVEAEGHTQAEIALAGLTILLPEALKVYEQALTSDNMKNGSLKLKAAGEVIKRLQEFEAKAPKDAVGKSAFIERLSALGVDDESD